MRIAVMIPGSSVDFENRKKILARKEMDQAYKKHAKYAEVSKNAMLATLENLLSGKTEKGVRGSDQSIKQEIRQLTATEHDARKRELAHKAVGVGVTGEDAYTRTTGPNLQYIIGGEVSTQALPTDGADKNVQAETFEDELDVEPFVNEDSSSNDPERFQTSVERNPEAETLFGRDLEQLIFKRMFNRATEKYMSHVAMVRNSLLAYNEPQFLLNA